MMKKLSVPMGRPEHDLGWIYLFFQLIALPIILSLCNQLLPVPLPSALVNVVGFVLNYICIWIIFHRFLWNNLKIAVQKPFRAAGCVLAALGAYFAATLLLGQLCSLYPGFSNLNDDAITAMFRQYRLALGITSVLLVPVAEETLYRGLIFRGLYNKNRFLAYALSAMAFSAIHVIGYAGQADFVVLLLCFVQYLPAGLCLGWVYAMTDTIWAPVLMHGLCNLISIVLTR